MSQNGKEEEFNPLSTAFQIKFWTVVGGAGILALAATRYKVAPPDQVLVKTGLGVKTLSGLSIHTKTVMWPFQKVMPISIAPQTISTRVLGMTSERIPLNLPFVTTIGPKMPEENSGDLSCLTNYARLLSQKKPEQIVEMIEAILAGESRILTAGMKADTIFEDRAALKRDLADEVNKILDQLGLKLINLNLEELHDDEESNSSYFRQQRLKALSRVEADAKIAVATAEMTGAVGQKTQEQLRRTKIAELEAETQKSEFERQRQIAVAEAAYKVAKSELDRQAAVAAVESSAASMQREFELGQEVEKKRSQQQIEQLRAADLSQKIVQAEILVQQTKGETDSKKLEAENQALMQVITAKADNEAKRIEADALLYARQQEAAGNLANSQAVAAGTEAVLVAEAKGLREKVEAAGGPQHYAVQALIAEDVLPKIAAQQAAAVKGMEPKIHVWSQSGDASSGTKAISNLVRDLPPLLDSIKAQTGLDIGAFLSKKLSDN